MVIFPTFTLLTLSLIVVSINGLAVQQLNQDKLIKSINQNKYTLVYFFSSKCGFCQNFTPKFQQISKVNKIDGIKFGKIDGPAYPVITQKYNINSYPSIALFWKGIDAPIFYLKQRQTENILNFLKLATKNIETTISKEQYNKLTPAIRNQGIFYSGSTQTQSFRITSVLSLIENYRPFIIINQTQKQKPSLQIKGQKYQIFDYKELTNVIRTQFAHVYGIEEQSWLRIHQKKHPGIIFVDTKNNKQVSKLLQSLASQFPHIVFMKIDPSQQEYEPALDALGLEDQQQIMGILKSADASFQATKPFTEQNLKQFIGGFLNLTWPVHRKSERQGDQHKLTRNNYDQKVNQRKDVIIFIYKDDDKIKRKFLELFKFLTTKLKQNKNLLLFRCNLSKNQIEQKIGFVPKVTPSIFFLRNRMKDYPIHFNYNRLTTENIIEFIMQNTTFDWEDEWSNMEQL